MTYDVIHSTQCYIEYINRDILANLHRRPLKLGRLLVLQKKYLTIKIQFLWQLTLLLSHLLQRIKQLAEIPLFIMF